MKHLNIKISFVNNLVKNIFFFSQVIIISLAVPSLYYVGITYNENQSKKQFIITNKGKKLIVKQSANGITTVKYVVPVSL